MTPDAFLQAFPNLLTVGEGRGKSRLAVGTKNLKRALKATWPHVEFSVTSSSYSGGSSFRVDWNEPLYNAPAAREIEALAGVFCYGRADGMNDSTEISREHWDFANRYGGAKYLHVNKHPLTDAQRAAGRQAELDTALPAPRPSRARPRM